MATAPIGESYAASRIGAAYVGRAGPALSERFVALARSDAADVLSASGVVSTPGGQVLSTSLTLTSAATASHPWTVGHVFKQGDLPAGSGLDGLQTNVISTWPDGSCRFAMVSGLSSLTATVPLVVGIAIGTPTPGAALTTVNLKATGITASISAGIFGSASWATTDWDSPFETWASGPRMSSWIYRQQIGADAHLVAWLEVRLWSTGDVEVLPWVENGHLLVTGPTNKSETYTFTLGGTSRFSQVIDIKHHTRVPLLSGDLSYWLGTSRAVTPAHNTAYIMASKMVPNYGFGAPSGATLDGLQQTYTPNTLAGINSGMGTGGTSAAMLPKAAALYLTSGGDARAYRASLVFGYSGGSWSIHYRDEENGHTPFQFALRPSVSTNAGGSPAIPVGAGGNNGAPVTTHQPSFGFFPALLTGRYWYVAEAQFWPTWNYVQSTPEQRRGMAYGQDTGTYPAFAAAGDAGVADSTAGGITPRGSAWMLNVLGQALSITPASHACFASYQHALDQNVHFYNTMYVTGTHERGFGEAARAGSDLGFLGEYGNPYGNATYWGHAGWMHGMQNQVLGQLVSMNLPITAGAELLAVMQHSMQWSIGCAGPDWNYRRFVTYAAAIGDGTARTLYATFAEALAGQEAFYSLTSLPSTAGLSLMQHSSNVDLTSASSSWPYFGQQLASLALAVEHGLPGAAAGWERVTGASNYATVAAAFASDPVYGITPRTAMPAWVPAAGTFSNISLNTFASAFPGNWPIQEAAGPFANWSGGAFAPDFGDLGGYVVHGSGHLQDGATLWAGVGVFDIGAQAWVARNVPSVPLIQRYGAEKALYYNQWDESTVAGSMGHTYPPHTYDGTVVQSAALGGGSSGSLWRAGMIGTGTAHKFDLASASAPASRVIDSLAALSSSAYPQTALDEARGGFWILSAVGYGPLGFVSFATGLETSYAGRSYNDNGNHNLTYLPPPYDCLIGMGTAPGNVRRIWVCPIVAGVPTSFTVVTQSGSGPADSRSGACWSTLLNCLVAYQAAGSYTVHKLTAPAPENIASAPWVWSSEVLAGNAGAVPSQVPGNQNGAWSRFIEVPDIRCFVWCDGIAQPTQAWRLTGM